MVSDMTKEWVFYRIIELLSSQQSYKFTFGMAYGARYWVTVENNWGDKDKEGKYKRTANHISHFDALANLIEKWYQDKPDNMEIKDSYEMIRRIREQPRLEGV